jgi:hypothetical protein
MKTFKKIEIAVAKNLIKVINENYNLVITENHAIGITRHLINEMNRNAEAIFTTKTRELKIFQALKRYFTTTKLNELDITKHSAYWFSVFLKMNYHIIIIKKLFK